MDYIGCWNTSQTYTGEHQGYLQKGSFTVNSFSIPATNDADAIAFAHKLSKELNYYLVSINEVIGSVPPFKSRSIYRHE